MTATGPQGIRSAARAAQAATALLDVLKRLVPIARRLVGFVKVVSIISAISAATILVSLLIIDVPTTVGPWLFGVVLAGALLLPALVLWWFYDALREVLALPAWLKTSPEFARDHASELANLVLDASGQGPVAGGASAQRARPLRDVPRAGRLLLEAHRDLPEYGSMLRLINVPFLIAVLVSFGATIFLALSAPLMLTIALVARALG